MPVKYIPADTVGNYQNWDWRGLSRKCNHYCGNRMPAQASAIGTFRQTSSIHSTLVGKEIVDHSNVVRASTVGTSSAVSSFSTWYLTSINWTKITARREEKLLSLGVYASYIGGLTLNVAGNWSESVIFRIKRCIIIEFWYRYNIDHSGDTFSLFLSIFYISQRLTLWYFVFLYLIFLSQQVLYFLLSTLVLTLYIDVVLSLSIELQLILIIIG